MEIPVIQARALFTQALIAVYKERVTPTQFLRSFFTVVETGSKYLSIEVQRGTEKIAVDVERGTEGNRNTSGKSSEKIFLPPYYREFFDATEIDLYDRLFAASGNIDDNTVTDFVQAIADKMQLLQEKIERAYEKQAADVFLTGVVSLAAGTNIDFKRKAASLVATPDGGYWTGSNDPFETFLQGATFLRTKGKAQGGIFNTILGAKALAALYASDTFKERAKWVQIALDAVAPPQRNAVGGTLHGIVSIDAYKSYIWSYPEFYDNTSGDSVPYIEDKKIVMLPEKPKFVHGFAAVPQLLKTNGQNTPQTTRGAYVISEYMDDRNVAHIFDIKSAGVCIPVAVDQIFTAKVLA